MIRVILVDDETLVKVGLKALADWEKLGFEIVAEGSNGEEALELIKEYEPHLLITDIVMPKLDGIELMRRAKELDPALQVIVLSSYDEFELVRKALKYGAWDYILKLNISRESMNELLEKVREVIAGEWAKKEEPLAEREDHWSLSAIRQVFLKSVIENLLPESETSCARVQRMELGLNEKRLFLGIVETNLYSLREKYCKDQDIQQLDFMLTNILAEIGNEFFQCYFLKWAYGVYVMVFSAEEGICSERVREMTDTMCDTLIGMLKKYVNLEAAVGISNICSGFRQLPIAFEQASQAIQGMFYRGFGAVLYYEEGEGMACETADRLKIDLAERLHRAMMISDGSAIQEVFADIAGIVASKRIEKRSIHEICNQIACLCDIHLGEHWHAYKRRIGQDSFKMEMVYSMRTVDEIRGWLENYRNGILNCLKEHAVDEKHVMVVRAKKFIAENIVGNITLHNVASHLKISSGYLSGLFPKYAGMCFTEYVNAVKVEKAQQFILQGQHKIYEISYMLGYDNACYFSRIFKRIAGCTPTEYQLIHTVENSSIKS